MGVIESELGAAFAGAVKRKSNNTKKLRSGNLRSKATRTAGGSSEVMVKITGFGKGAAHVKAHLDYITRNGKLEMENEQGETFLGKDDVKRLFGDWATDIESKDISRGAKGRHREQRDTMHMMLSMPESTNPEDVRKAVRAFTKEAFSKNYEYVFALHTDQAHPHCHVTVKCLGFDGKRLNPRKADIQEWREVFAVKLREQGVDAEATPRQSRGVVRKAEPNVIRHIEAGDKTHEPRISTVKALKKIEAALEIKAELGGLPLVQKPWEAVIVEKQKVVRQAWLAAADAIENEKPPKLFNKKEPTNDRPDDRRISKTIREQQRGAALYQSNIGKSGPETPPKSFAGLRDLPRVNLVSVERSSQMLLHKDALDNVGGQRSSDHGMRRPGISTSSAPGGAGRLAGYVGAEVDNKELAGRIRSFVGAMPTMATERQQIKMDLTARMIAEANLTARTSAGIGAKPQNTMQPKAMTVPMPQRVKIPEVKPVLDQARGTEPDLDR